jgi:hypothetical protein
MAPSLTPLLARVNSLTSWAQAAPGLYSLLLFVRYSSRKPDAYNILWVLVFGFATLNILGLVARRFDPDRSRLNFGEILAIMVVLVSLFLLTSEMLYLFKVFPIKLHPR